MIQFESSSTPEKSVSGEFLGDMVWFLTDSDDESDFLAEFHVGEERVEEVMQELYREITYCGSANTHVPPLPPPISLPSQPSSAAMGLESESCGAAFSAVASSVVAGIEFAHPASAGKLEAVPVEAEMAFLVEVESGGGGDLGAEEKKATGMRMDGYDGSGGGGDESDQWLKMVLGWRPMDVEE